MQEKYTAEAIRKINSIMGAGHRVRPYDLSNAADLKEALLVTVAAYRDYQENQDRLAGLEEDFDESLEYCDIAVWLDLAHGEDEIDSLTVEGFSSLIAAADAFGRLEERARKNCARIVKAILTASPATQRNVLGCAYKIEPQEIDEKTEALFEMLQEAEYHQAMPDNLEVFLEIMKEQWAAYMA
jgi:hypothetical protein